MNDASHALLLSGRAAMRQAESGMSLRLRPQDERWAAKLLGELLDPKLRERSIRMDVDQLDRSWRSQKDLVNLGADRRGLASEGPQRRGFPMIANATVDQLTRPLGALQQAAREGQADARLPELLADATGALESADARCARAISPAMAALDGCPGTPLAEAIGSPRRCGYRCRSFPCRHPPPVPPVRNPGPSPR